MCTVCEAGSLPVYLTGTDVSTDCLFECRSGLYNSMNNGPSFAAPYCRKCDKSCTECSWMGAQDCLECPHGYYLESDHYYDLYEKSQVDYYSLPPT